MRKVIAPMSEYVGSEIARTRRQIEAECYAMNLALHGTAIVARHDIITHRYNGIGQAQEHLATLVGEPEAARIAAQTYLQTVQKCPSLTDLLNAYNKSCIREPRLSMAHLAQDTQLDRSIVYDLAQGKPVSHENATRIIAAFNARTQSRYTLDEIAVVLYD